MTKPLVSILVPAHNAQQTIADTLRSALAQTWPNTEIIVVDDGSCDQTAAVVCRVGGDRVRLVRQNCQGAAAARNAAYSLCHGEFIQWLDADDLLAPGKIASQVDVLTRVENVRTLASGPWGCFIHRPNHADFRPTGLWTDLSPTEWMLRKMRDNLQMQTATWLVSRALTEAAGPWDTRLSFDDDGEYFGRVLLASDAVRFVPDARVYYRMSGRARLSHIGASRRKIESLALSMRLHVEHLLSLEDSPRAREACSNYFRSWLPYFCYADPNLIDGLHRLAAGIGVTLRPPTLSWRYRWLGRLFGWRLASQVQLTLPQWKWLFVRPWDKALLHIEHARLAAANRRLDSIDTKAQLN